MRQSPVEQGFAQTLVGIFELHVLSDNGDARFARGMMHAVHEVQPRLHVRRMILQLEKPEDLRVQPFFAEFGGHGVNGVHVFHGNDAGFHDVAEERNFFLQVRGNVVIAAAKQDVRLNPDAQHFFHAVLRGLGFEFAGSGDERNQRDVNEESVFRAELEAHLADGFEEGKRFDVADRAANLHDDDVDAVGDFFDSGFVDAAGGPVIVAGKFGVSEALVVAEVEVGLRAVFGDKDFAMLKGAHRTGIDVQVRIAFLQGDFETTTFEETTNRGGCYAFSQ